MPGCWLSNLSRIVRITSSLADSSQNSNVTSSAKTVGGSSKSVDRQSVDRTAWTERRGRSCLMAASVAPCRCIDKLSDGTDNSCVKIAKSYLCTILFLSLLFSPCAAGLASRQHVYVSGTVQSFGSYHFTPALSF